MGANPICEFLEWDSEFFGKRIARANVSVLNAKILAELEGWCAGHKVDCLYFLANSADQETAQLAHTNDFRQVDVRITLERRVDSAPTAVTFTRPAEENDISALRRIARYGHRDTRFYYDGNFSTERCHQLYETWIEKSCHGLAKRVLVAVVDRSVLGYLTCDLPDLNCGQIGLLGVAEEARGKGIGTALIFSGLSWFAAQGAQRAKVVTQGRNVPAQRLYQNCGFVTRSVELWFHRWFTRQARP